MSDPTKRLITDRRTKPRGLLDGIANFSGPMDAKTKLRLRAVIERPTRETWHNAYSLVLHPRGITLWNAVACVDPTFPIKGPGQAGARGWERVPDQLTIVRAIRAAVSGRVTRKQVLARSMLPDGP